MGMKQTAIWSFDVFSPGIQEKIAQNASDTGLNIADYLESFQKPWTPALSLAEIDESVIEEAKKLRAALLPALQSNLLKGTERVQRGLEDYKREFGHEVSERHWQRLIERALRRMGGSENFERLELYLPEKLKAKNPAQRLTPGESEFADLLQIIRACRDANAPTDGERAAIWSAAFEIFDEAANAKKEKHLRRALVKFLFRHAPALAASEHALRVSFDRKHARWIEGERSAAALQDGRLEKKGSADGR